MTETKEQSMDDLKELLQKKGVNINNLDDFDTVWLTHGHNLKTALKKRNAGQMDAQAFAELESILTEWNDFWNVVLKVFREETFQAGLRVAR